MKLKTTMCWLAMTASALAVAFPGGAQEPESYGWLGTETLKTRVGDFEFKGGYPAGDTAERLLDLRKLNQATEVYLTQLMPVSEIGLREGLRAFGAKKPNQVVIWENLMDAKTVLLTANTETVYALSHLDLKTDGPTVVEAPPKMLGLPAGRFAAIHFRCRPIGSGQGQGRQVPRSAARLRWRCSRRILRGEVADLLGDTRAPRLPG